MTLSADLNPNVPKDMYDHSTFILRSARDDVAARGEGERRAPLAERPHPGHSPGGGRRREDRAAALDGGEGAARPAARACVINSAYNSQSADCRLSAFEHL